MPGYSKECQPIAGNVTGLETDIASFQKELQTAEPGAKSALIHRIEQLESQLDQQRALLADCVKEHPYVPPPPPPKNPCLKLKKEEEKLEEELTVAIEKALAPIQAELQKAPSGAKPGLIALINKTRADLQQNSPLSKQIAEATNAYNACVLAHGGLSALAAKFKGKATLKSNNPHFDQPVSRDVTIDLEFSDWDHSKITVTSFPEITKSFSLGIGGHNTETVALTSGTGSYDRQSHSISFHLDLAFLATNDLVGNSSLNIELMSNDPLPHDGKLTVFGGAKFQGGALDGYEGTLNVTGTISPHP